MATNIDDSTRTTIADAIYAALREYDYQKRSARNMRIALGGRGPTVKRGTARGALTLYLTDAVLKALKEEA